MPAIDFPDSPVSGDIYSNGARTWIFDGTVWGLISSAGVVSTIYAPINSPVFQGDVAVSGGLVIDDNIVVLNNDTSGAPVDDAGIEIERGSENNVRIIWNETTNTWQFTNDGVGYENLGSGGGVFVAESPQNIPNPAEGQVWFNSNTGKLYVYFDSFWVEIGGGSGNASLGDVGDVLFSQTFSIGDTGPAGGKIFITPSTAGNSTGKYFEVAPSASQVTRTWSSEANWVSPVAGADGTAIGTGEQNTADIVAQSGNLSASSAAVYASEYSVNGYSDWFLPSKNEVNELKNNFSVLGLNSGYYWTSSESSGSLAWMVQVHSGDAFADETNKSASNQVRPVRSFVNSGVVLTGQLLQWNGSNWINSSSIQTQLDALEADVQAQLDSLETDVGNLEISKTSTGKAIAMAIVFGG